MPQMEPQELYQRCKLAWNETANWRTLLDDAYSMACPGRNAFRSEQRSPGEQVGAEIFDSTLIHSHGRLANRIIQALFPAFQDWAEYIPGNTTEAVLEASGDEDALTQRRAEARAITDVCFASIHNSNFSPAIHEVLKDIAFGTSAFLVNDMPIEDSEMFEINPVNPAYLALDEGPNGSIWGIFRKHELRPHVAEGTWLDAKWPENWTELRKNSEFQMKKVKFDECNYFCPKTKKWYFDVLVHMDSNGSDKDTPIRIVSRTYNVNRWIISRWSKNTGEAFGRGPVLDALYDAKTLNKVMELLLINGSLSIAPPFTAVDDGVFNPGTFSLEPGAINMVGYNSTARGKSIETLEIGGDLRMTQFIFDNMQMSIRKMMLDDQMPPEAGAVRSATEWNARQSELANAIGAPFGRIFHELVRPFMAAVLDIHVEAGLFQQMSANAIDGHNLDLKITAPFAQAENVNEVNAMAQFLEMMGMLGEEVLMDSVKVENVAGYIASKMGLPVEKFVRTAQEQAEKKAEMQQQMQQAQQQEQNMALEQEAMKQQGGQQQAPQQGPPQ